MVCVVPVAICWDFYVLSLHLESWLNVTSLLRWIYCVVIYAVVVDASILSFNLAFSNLWQDFLIPTICLWHIQKVLFCHAILFAWYFSSAYWCFRYSLSNSSYSVILALPEYRSIQEGVSGSSRQQFPYLSSSILQCVPNDWQGLHFYGMGFFIELAPQSVSYSLVVFGYSLFLLCGPVCKIPVARLCIIYHMSHWYFHFTNPIILNSYQKIREQNFAIKEKYSIVHILFSL